MSNEQCIEINLNSIMCSIDEQNEMGHTLLHLLVMVNKIEFVKILRSDKFQASEYIHISFWQLKVVFLYIEEKLFTIPVNFNCVLRDLSSSLLLFKSSCSSLFLQ